VTILARIELKFRSVHLADRAELLAKCAAWRWATASGSPTHYRQMAELCVAAEADQTLIEPWIEVGRQQAAPAAAILYTALPPES
jgi:hypothetical protein